MLELARQTDREAVNTLAAQVHAMHVSWRPDIYKMAEELYPEERYIQVIKARELYVARVGDVVVGYAAVKIRDFDWAGMVRRKVMLVDEVCVEESFRNQGIGRQMMEELRILARAFGCTDLQLNVNAHNDAAVGFYQKCGFMIQNISMQRKV